MMAEQFCQQTFADLETSSYPVLPAVGYQSSVTKIIYHEIDQINSSTGSDSPYTLATKLQAAWALLLAQYANTQDVVFGTTRNNLQEVASLQDVFPLRVPVNRESDLAQWLQANQSRVGTMQDVQPRMSLGQIQSCSPEAKEACEFRTSIVLRDSETKTHEVCTNILLPDAVHGMHPSRDKYISARDPPADPLWFVARETTFSTSKGLSVEIPSF